MTLPLLPRLVGASALSHRRRREGASNPDGIPRPQATKEPGETNDASLRYARVVIREWLHVTTRGDRPGRSRAYRDHSARHRAGRRHSSFRSCRAVARHARVGPTSLTSGETLVRRELLLKRFVLVRKEPSLFLRGGAERRSGREAVGAAASRPRASLRVMRPGNPNPRLNARGRGASNRPSLAFLPSSRCVP